ncbi:hypothetical protein GCM10007301_55180 [Azorhizobium oxalatiphilum]|uniref:Transmembrane protein n=2 Tax=Azorhizobium oxalatiphilum TaxID=980631 RepID=A0A917FJ31_9HYPH|nr:hypothetical protein GCM10007301_55180 [Azorhizobium oxalatiphilum]
MVIALLFLIEAWLWAKTAPMVRWVIQHIPFERAKQALAEWARRLPPYGALVLFIVPLILIEPINILALWFYAHKQFVLGSLCFLVAKLVGVGLMAFLFEACREQLRSIRWFSRLIDWVIAANHWAHSLVEPYKQELKAAFAAWTKGKGNGFWRRVMDIRRRAFRGG